MVGILKARIYIVNDNNYFQTAAVFDSKIFLRSLPRLFPISFDCIPGFWFLLFSFYDLISNDSYVVLDTMYVLYYFLRNLCILSLWMNDAKIRR